MAIIKYKNTNSLVIENDFSIFLDGNSQDDERGKKKSLSLTTM
jgi:hypothetical protein